MKKFLVLSLVLLSFISVKNSFANEYNEGYINQCGGHIDKDMKDKYDNYGYTDHTGRAVDKDDNYMW